MPALACHYRRSTAPVVYTLRFADDISLLAYTERELAEALNLTKTVFNNCNMKSDMGKNNAIACRTKSGKRQLNVKIVIKNIGAIREFCYSGSKITRDGLCNADIHS